MNHKIILLLLISIFLISSAIVLAKPGVEQDRNDKSVPITIPAHAVRIADNVYSLGQAKDIDGKAVEGFLFIHGKKGEVKPSRPVESNKCYQFLAQGAKWKKTEDYVTGDGIDAVLTETSLNTWNSQVSFDLFGMRDELASTDGIDFNAPDNKNEVEFAYLGDSSTIATTVVWGVFLGPPRSRELVEWDTTFNTFYDFGNADSDPSVMDYQNIATHEFGHAFGLGHPGLSCTEETMYQYADFGETKKRDLNTGDIAGIKELYNN